MVSLIHKLKYIGPVPRGFLNSRDQIVCIEIGVVNELTVVDISQRSMLGGANLHGQEG